MKWALRYRRKVAIGELPHAWGHSAKQFETAREAFNYFFIQQGKWRRPENYDYEIVPIPPKPIKVEYIAPSKGSYVLQDGRDND